MKKIVLLVFIIILSYSSVLCQNLMDIAEPDNYVVDLEGVFTPDEKADLINIMKDYEAKTSIQFCLATSANFDFMYSTDLAKQWKIGQKGLNNGFVIIFSKAQRHIEYRTGYGLEEFLPDGWLSRYRDSDLIPYFKNELYYDGLRAFIVACQDKIGFDGYAFLIKNKERKAAEHKAAVSNFFSHLLNILLILILLAGIGYLIYFLNKRKQVLLKLKNEINTINFDINTLYSWIISSGYKLPINLENMYNSRIFHLTKKLITEDTKNYNNNIKFELVKYKKLVTSILGITDDIQKIYNSFSELNIKLPKDLEDLYMDSKIVTTETQTELQTVYNKLSDYKKMILDINECIKYLENKKIEISNWVEHKFRYCIESNINELNLILNIIEINTEYTTENLIKLKKTINIINSKFNAFKIKLDKVNDIVDEINSFIINITKSLKKSYLNYLEQKNILSNAKIGDFSKNINIDEIDNNLRLLLVDSEKFLKNDDLDNAIKTYNAYLLEKTSILNYFETINKLFSDYNNSLSYISLNKSKISDYISSIENNINKDGVTSNRKSVFNTLKSKATMFMTTPIVDVIYGAETLKNIIDELDNLLRNIKQDIQNEIERIRRIQEEEDRRRREEDRRRREREDEDRRRNSYNSYSSYDSGSSSSSSYDSGSSFSSGGGDFGGGGGGGSW
jgi:uncharacterized membrane protein YgcG